MTAVSQNGLALGYASEGMKGDREIVMTAVSEDGLALTYATEEMKGDHEIVMAAVSQYGLALRYAAKEVRGDPQVVKTALANRHDQPLIALRVSLLSGRYCDQIFDTDLHGMEDMLRDCADMLGS